MALGILDWLGLTGGSPSTTSGFTPFVPGSSSNNAIGYDPSAARLASIGAALTDAGIGLATSPRGQGLIGALQGATTGAKRGLDQYRGGLLDNYKWRELERQEKQQEAQDAYLKSITDPSATYSVGMQDPALASAQSVSGGRTGPGTNKPYQTASAPTRPNGFEDLPDNVWAAVQDAARMGDFQGARKLVTDYRINGTKLSGPAADLQSAIKAGYVPPDTTLDEFQRIGKDPAAPIVKDFYQDGLVIQKQWNPKTQGWVEVGRGQRFATPQPSDFQRKLDEVAKIYRPGTKEYNDAVLNISGAAKAQGFSMTQNPDGTFTVSYGGKAPTDTQATASGYFDRAQEADKQLGALLDKGYSPSLKDVAANSGGALGNYIMSDEAQQFYQAQRNFINAVLRKESGAVIGPSEFENAQKQYFPQPGDSDAVLKQKAENRRQAIEALKRSSGPAADMITPPPPASGAADNDPLGIR